MSEQERGEQPPVVDLGRLGTLHPVDEKGIPKPVSKEEKPTEGEPPVVDLIARVYRGPSK
jgi:hypothetical protein